MLEPSKLARWISLRLASRYTSLFIQYILLPSTSKACPEAEVALGSFGSESNSSSVRRVSILEPSKLARWILCSWKALL